MPETKISGESLFAGLPPRRHCALPGGTVSYREAGSPADVPVVLLHGIGNSSAGWVQQFVSREEGSCLIAWDAPGYGDSSLLEPAVKAEAYAQRLYEFMSAMGIARARLMANSWGTLTALAFLRLFPDRVRSLVLSGPSVGQGAQPRDVREAIAANRLKRLKELGPVRAAQEDAGRLVAEDTHALAAAYLPLCARDVTIEGFARALHVLCEADGVSMAPLKHPVLIIAGAEDQIAPMPAHAKPLAAAAANARLEILSRCGHLPHFELPAAFAKLVREFWEESADG